MMQQGATVTPLVAAQATTQPAAQPRIRAGSVVRPETVTVADVFTYNVTVEVPRDARVEWPSINDSTAAVSQRAPARVRDEPAGDLRRETASYSLAAWDTGSVSLGLPDAVVRIGDQVIRVPLGAQVYVRSVLPGDTSQHVPKPARDLFARQVPWWEQWWLAAAVIGALALLYWLYRRRRAPKVMRSAPVLDHYARAMHDFERLDRLALADSGERGRYVALAVEVLRTYLTARVSSVTLSQTSSELVTAVRDDTRVPVTRLAPLLGETDAIKFARYPITLERARELASEARGVVDDVERAEKLRLAMMAEQKAKEEKEVESARRRDEDAARKKSRRKGAA